MKQHLMPLNRVDFVRSEMGSSTWRDQQGLRGTGFDESNNGIQMDLAINNRDLMGIEGYGGGKV